MKDRNRVRVPQLCLSTARTKYQDKKKHPFATVPPIHHMQWSKESGGVCVVYLCF